jgi:predicted Fe-Mo cluster-binding NifX family protein
VNTSTGKVETVENPGCHTRQGECHHVGMLARRGVDAVIVTGMGREAWSGLKDAGIEVYTAAETGVGDLVRCVNRGEATRIAWSATCAGGFRKAHRHRHGQSGQSD